MESATITLRLFAVVGNNIFNYKFNNMKKYTEKDLVDFGNQLLSKDREVLHEINLHQVTDADLDAFKDNKNKGGITIHYHGKKKYKLVDSVTVQGVIQFLDKLIFKDDKRTVYLFTYGQENNLLRVNEQSILISSNPREILNNIFSNKLESNQIHIQEYTNFEEAYTVAVSMREPDDLCYE